jgi:hypothetical protein
VQEGLAADVVVLVVSAAAVRKPWWQEEFAGAMPAVVAGRQRLIPVLLDEVDVPPFAAGRVYIDFRYVDSPDGYEAKIHELVAAVRGHAPRQRPPRDGTIVLPPMGSRAEGRGWPACASRPTRSYSASPTSNSATHPPARAPAWPR